MKKEVKKPEEVLDVSEFKKILDREIQKDVQEIREGRKRFGVIIIDSDGTIKRGRA
ncbi:MAG: hypothetical protein JHC31_15240 [Sulfurihydrogenibium sp.]|jgi:hypothetical protein|nr:hypothetical protein [Sulfurihydrogenibium sp.]